MIDSSNKISLKIYYHLLCSYALFLPLFNNFTTPILVLLAIVTLLDYNYLKKFWAYNKKDFVVLGLPLVFLLTCISLIYTTNYESGLKYLTKSLPFLLMPLVLFKVKNLSNKQLNIICKLFVLGCAAIILYSFLFILYESIEGSYKKVHSPENYTRYFLNRLTYHDLVSKNSVDHSIYFGAYILLAITILKLKKQLFSNVITKSLLALFYLSLILLTPIIICIAGLVVFSLYYFIYVKPIQSKKNNKKLLLISLSWAFLIFYLIIWKITVHQNYIYLFIDLKYNFVILFGVVGVVILNFFAAFFYTYNRLRLLLIIPFILLILYVITLTLVDFRMNTQNMSNFTARFANNFASASIIKDNLMFGVGIGDVQESLEAVYREIRFRKLTYNEHNQYLRVWLSSGLVTFLLFCFWIYKVTISAIKYKKSLLICVSITLLLFCFTESVFARQMGTSFFLFFLFFFYFSENEKPIKKVE